MKKEYRRMMKSISTISIIAVLTIIEIISFAISLSDKNMFLSQLNLPAADINITALQKLIEDYNGFKFMFDSWFLSDLYFIFIVALMLFIGIFLSYQVQKHKDDCYGNLLVSRIGYKKYLANTLISQSLYIFSIIAITNLLSLIIAFIFGGLGNGTDLATFNLNAVQSLSIIFVQTMFMSVIMVLINGCSLLVSSFIKNKYFLQAFPLLVFLIIPQLIVSTLGNISDFIGKITMPFVLWNEFMAIDNILNEYTIKEKFSVSEVIYYIIPIITYLVLLTVLYLINLKKNEREYI